LAPAPVILSGPIVPSTDSGGQIQSTKRAPTYDELLAILNIPPSLSERPKGNVDIRIAWGKWKGYQSAQSLYYRIKNGKTWTFSAITADTIIELFVSKTVYHRNYKKLFPRVSQFPDLVSWLEQEEEGPSAMDVWGVDKSFYTFVDLERLLDKLEEKKEKKGKRKAENSGEGKSHKKAKKASGSH